MTTPLQILPGFSLDILDQYADPLITPKYASLAFAFPLLVGIGVTGYGDLLLSFTTIAAATLAVGYVSREALANFVSGVAIPVEIRSDFTQMVKRRFDQEGVSLPGTQRELSGELSVNGDDGARKGEAEKPGRSDADEEA